MQGRGVEVDAHGSRGRGRGRPEGPGAGTGAGSGSGLKIDTAIVAKKRASKETREQRVKREYIDSLNSEYMAGSSSSASSAMAGPLPSDGGGTLPAIGSSIQGGGPSADAGHLPSSYDNSYDMMSTNDGMMKNPMVGGGGDGGGPTPSTYQQHQPYYAHPPHQQMQQQQLQMQMQMQQQQIHMDQQMYHDDASMMDHQNMMLSGGGASAGGYIEDDDDDDEEEEEEHDELDEDYESSSSLPEAEEDIDYDVVYALHTFLATVEGQASVVKGDQLTLLDDSNSYWWLVRVLKTQLVGYIPAENIETPEERLARFYKKQNLNHTKARDTDITHGAASARRAQNHFRQPHHPSNRMLQESLNRPKVQLNREVQGGGRYVDFGPPSFQEYVGYEYSDEDTDASMEEGDEEYDEDGRGRGIDGGDFDDEEEGEEEEGDDGSEGSFEGGSMEDDGHTHHLRQQQHQHHHQQQQQQQQHHLHQQYHQHQQHQQQLQQQQGVGQFAGPGYVQTADERHQDADEDITQQYTMRNTDSYAGGPLQPYPDNVAYAAGGPGQGESGPHSLTASSAQSPSRMNQAKAQAALGVANGNRPAQFATPVTSTSGSGGPDGQERIAPSALNRSLSVDEQLRAERDSTAVAQTANPQNVGTSAAQGQGYTAGSAITKQKSPTGSTSSTSSNRLKAFSDNATGSGSPTTSQENETRKISLTPKIARENSVDSNLSDGAAVGPHASHHQHNLLQPTQGQQRQSGRNASNASSAMAGDISTVSSTISGGGGRLTPIHSADSEDQVHYRRGSAGSASSSLGSAVSGASSAQKRGSSPATSEAASGSSNASKKKKSGGILGGLFSRNKKDKKDDKDKKTGARRVSGSTSDDDRGSGTSSPAPESPESQKGRSSPSVGPVTQQLQQRRAVQQVKEDMFGNEAARRQQQVEAQTVMYQNYGINPRAPGDTSNTSTFAANSASPPTIVQSPPTISTPPDAPPSSGPPHISAHHTAMTASPSSSSMQSSLSASLGPVGQRLRPGSLIGSPHMAGPPGSGEVPVLNVLRVFAGDNIMSDATFKTVLLNDGTSTEDLVKQAMQRFRLDPPIPKDPRLSTMDAILEEYYLTAKEVDGEETRLQPGQRPLKIVENLSHAAGYLQPGQGFPSVKRSSVGSISSISSTLSMNPAIEKLRMSDFSDDSHVKLFINKRTSKLSDAAKRASDSSSTATITGKGISDDLLLDASRLSGSSYLDKLHGNGPQSPLLRFAVKLVIYPQDIPESMAFDPYSNALIAKSALPERQQQISRNGHLSSTTPLATHREKVLFFPKNANVSEMLETALDRFGIVEGVVDGGDDVDSKNLKRRSMSRIKYCLAVSSSPGSREGTILGAGTKVLEAYRQPPAFKTYERSSKEFRRRSMESPYNAPSSADLQSTDPVFVIRRAVRSGVAGSLANSLRAVDDTPLQAGLAPQERSNSRASNMTSTGSVYATPMAEIPPSLERALSPQQAKQEIIAAQRAASRATQRAMISAHKNERHGVDVVLSDKSTIRSSRDGGSMRYSYIAADGASEIDISEIVENEWRSDSRLDSREGSVTPIPPRDSPSAMSHMTAESYASALTSPLTPATSLPGHSNTRAASTGHDNDEDAEERVATDKVAPVNLSANSRPRDHLEQALGPKRGGHGSSPSAPGNTTSEVLDDRLDRVLAKVRAGNASSSSSGMASALRNQQQGRLLDGGSDPKEQSARSSTESGRTTPATMTRADSTTSDRGPSYVSQMMRARSGSATSNGSTGRSSPGPQALERIMSSSARSTPQPEAPPSSGSSTPRRAPGKGHAKQSSVASLASDSSSARSQSPSTPATISAGNTTLTPVSSTRNDSSTSHRLAIPYREDLGLDYLMQLVHSESESVNLPPIKKPDVIDILQGVYDWPSLSPEIAAIYERPKRQLDDLDRRLDLLLEQALAT